MTFAILKTPKSAARTREKLDTEVAGAQAALDAAKAKRQAWERRSYQLWCESCAKHIPIENWTFLVNHWYEEPYGCTGGDRWLESHTHSARCPCGAVLQLNAPTNSHPILMLNKQRHLFAGVENVFRYSGNQYNAWTIERARGGG